MRKLKIWREGARAKISGSNFAMNPYAPHPNPTNEGWSMITGFGLAWARGYWWASKNRASSLIA